MLGCAVGVCGAKESYVAVMGRGTRPSVCLTWKTRLNVRRIFIKFGIGVFSQTFVECI